MMPNDRFGGTVSAWLQERAGSGAPDYLDDILGRTARTRQRPGWTSIERWLPMDATLRLAPAPRLAWLLVVLGLVLALAAAVALVGSAPKLPPQFGPARNGPMAYSENGDIVRLDQATGATTTLIAGATNDLAPSYSDDGRFIVFVRAADDYATQGTVLVAVARADGSDVRVLTGPMKDQNWFDWSADSSRLALMSLLEGKRAITIVDLNGTPPRVLPLPRSLEPQFASFVGPDASRLIFRGVDQSAKTTGVYAIGADGSDLHPIFDIEPGVLGGYQAPAVSPDGSRVSYTRFEEDPVTGTGNLVIHVRDFATRSDVLIPAAPDPENPTEKSAQGYAYWSPDGTLLAFQRFAPNDGMEVIVAPADGSDVGRKLGPTLTMSAQKDAPAWEFTPDGSAVLVPDMVRNVLLKIPVDGSEPITLPFDGESLPTTQRQAP